MSFDIHFKMLPLDLIEVIYDLYLDLVECEKTYCRKKIVIQDMISMSICPANPLWWWCPVCGEKYILETGVCQCFWSLNMII